MKVTLRLTTYLKLVLLIIGICFLFLSLFLSLYLYTVQQEEDVFNGSLNQYQSEINNLFNLNSKTQIRALNDLTFWDDLANFSKTRNTIWFDHNIGNAFSTYEVDYIGAYDLNKKIITKVSSSNFKSHDFISIHTLNYLYNKKFIRFYTRIPEGIIEVFGATIHNSNDPYKIKTKPSGYFFMGRLLNQKYLKDLESMTSSKIKILDKVYIDSTNNSMITSVVKLRDSDNRIIGNLLFERPSNLHFENTKKLLLIIVIATLISLFASIYYSRKWFYKPLKLITNILETDSGMLINDLKREPGEFGYIGNLFEEYRKNKFQLERSKQKAEESDKLKSTFLANLSHEIRTPMNAIIGFADLLMDESLSVESQKKYLKIIKNSGRSLVSIIEDLIEMSKIDAKQITPNVKGLDIDKCVNELYNTLKVTIPEEKIVSFYLIENKDKLKNDILTDEVKLKQIVVNLLTNAIKFTDIGHIAFGYTVNHDKAQLEFRVEDTGLGISEKDLKVIFERFRRVDDDYSISLGGLGLGLSISKAYVEMLGGRIMVESIYGEGSVFKFTIPLIYDQTNFEAASKDKEKSNIDSDVKTILVAEDDNINYLLLKTILERKNHIVIRARNGQEAVDIADSDPEIDLIFMDIKMPILDGFEAFEIIKKERPTLPIIAQTAHSSVEVKTKIADLGFTGYITKPLDKEKIYELISAVFKK